MKEKDSIENDEEYYNTPRHIDESSGSEEEENCPNMRKITSGCTFHNHLNVGCVKCERCIHIALDPQWGPFQQDHVKTLLTSLMPLSNTKVLLATSGWKSR